MPSPDMDFGEDFVTGHCLRHDCGWGTVSPDIITVIREFDSHWLSDHEIEEW